MRVLAVLSTLAVLAVLPACTTPTGDDANTLTYRKWDGNQSKTDDPIKALQRY